MENIQLNLHKKQEKINEKAKKPKKINGVRVLYLINLKRMCTNKSIIATSIVFLVISLIFNIISSKFLVDPTTIEIGLIILSIAFFFEVFTFILFMTIASVDLVKKQMLDGIQHIETRSGIPMRKSFLLRYFVFITVIEFIAIINLIITVFAASSFIWDFSIVSGIIWSKIFFFILIGLIWTPIIFIITTLCSVSGSVMLNIFISIIIVMSSLFSSMYVSLSNPTVVRNNFSVMKKNIKLDISNSFYNTLKDDENVNKIFNDTGSNNNSLLFDTLNSKFTLLGIENEFKFNEISYLSINANGNGFEENTDIQKRAQLLKYSLYGGMPNISLNPYIEYLEEIENAENGQTPFKVGENETFLLSGLAIFDILQEIYLTVNEGMLSDNNKPPVNKPGYSGGLLPDNTNFETHDLEPLIDWIKVQPNTSKYSNLLDWTLSTYNKYKDIFKIFLNSFGSGGRGEESIFPLYFASEFDWVNTLPGIGSTKNEYNIELSKVYKRYPELILINWLITQSWLNTMTSEASLYKEEAYWSSNSSDYANEEEVYKGYQNLVNESILKNQINIFQHFGSMYFNLFGSSFNRDFILSDSVIMYTGITKGYSNYLDLAKVDLRKNDGSKPLTPIFETVSLEKKLGFNTWLAYFAYFLISILMAYLAYLTYKRKSRI